MMKRADELIERKRLGLQRAISRREGYVRNAEENLRRHRIRLREAKDAAWAFDRDYGLLP